jgi:parallel beta-helix repeat protein
MIFTSLALLSSLAFLSPDEHDAPCLRPTRAGTQVQGEVRVCPGRYRIPDKAEHGVIIVASSGTRIDLTGVVLESGDSVPGRFVGAGIASRSVDRVTITGGVIRGYRYGVRLEGGKSHRVSGADLSGSRSQGMGSGSTRPDAADRLDLLRSDSFVPYGGGLLLRGTVEASVTGITAGGAQNGIALLETRDSYIADNNVASNTGWGIHLWRSSHNIIARNQVDHTLRCQTQVPPADCGAAAILLRDASDSNTIVDNDLTASSLGLLLTGERPLSRPSIGNLVYRNNASSAIGVGFTLAYGWANSLLDNRADSAAVGVRLEHSGTTTVRGNTVIGSRTGILSNHGADIAILANVLIGGGVGIRVGAPEQGQEESRRYRIDDNVLARLEQGIVVERTTRAQLRGNLFDGVGDGLVLDGAGHATEVTGNVFLRASRWFIEAPDLAAGGNYWATADASAATAKVKGRISILPWKPASAVGY